MDGPEARERATRWRRQTAPLLAGVVVGLLVAGLLVPLGFGESLTVSSGGGDSTQAPLAAGDGGRAGEAGTSAPGLADTPASDGAPADRGEATTADGSPTTGAAAEPGGAAAPEDGPLAPGDGNTEASGSTGSLPASDRGVTPEQIKLGILLLEVGSLAQIGVNVAGVSADEQREAWQVYIDRLNERGGVLGREVEPIYRAYDVTSPDDMRADCRALADEGVFAALDAPGGFFGPPVLCVVEEHEMPLVSYANLGMPDQYFRASGGRLFTAFQSGNRAMRNLADQLHRLGEIDGERLGIVADLRNGPEETADTLEASLEALGYEVAHRVDLSADLSVGASQIPIAVQEMRTNGVEGVLLISNTVYATQFVQEADSQRYHPDYYTSDWQAGSTDVYAQSMPTSFEGSVSIAAIRTNDVLADLPEPEHDARCRHIYEDGNDDEVERGSNRYGVLLRPCTVLGLFADAAAAAGPELTTERFGEQMQALGERPMVMMLGGALRPGKPDAAGRVWTLRWQGDCRCWIPASSPRPIRS